MSSKLSGKRVVVVGGSSGLGFGVAKASLESGASVIISSSDTARIDDAIERLKPTLLLAQKQYPAANITVGGKTLDLRDGEPAVKTFFDGLDQFDHLVWSAGDALQIGALESLDLSNARRAFDVRTLGPLYAGKYAPAHMPKSADSSITLTIGGVAFKPPKGWVLMATILGGTKTLTKALAVELAPIRVNVVSPGMVKTELWRDLPEAVRDGMYEGTAQKLLVGHVAEADEVAEAYLYLMKCAYVTGDTLMVDGGHLLA